MVDDVDPLGEGEYVDLDSVRVTRQHDGTIRLSGPDGRVALDPDQIETLSKLAGN